MKYKIESIIILIVIGFTTGCGSKLDSGGLTPLSLVQFQSTPDTTAPTVSAWSPQGTGIGLTTVISVRFSERMAAATINTSTFTVVSGGVAVSGTVAYSSGVYVFTPAAPLAYITTYTVTIVSAVTDRAGNPLASAFSWSFTTVDKGTLPAPTITPIGGTFDSSQTVSIQYSGPAATIYYTTDGSAPSTSSSSFSGTSLDINVAINTTIRAFAAENSSYYDSAEATDVYNIRTTQPVFTHDTGSYPNDMTLTTTELYHPDGGTIYYTMTTGTTAAPPADPADPDTGSTVFNASDTIAIAGDLTVVKIKAAALLANMTMSQPVMRTYTIDYVQIGAPSFSLDPATGPFDGTQTLQMTHTAAPQPQIYYTLDGSDPTDVLNAGRLSYTYGTDISISDTTTINAYAEGAANSMKDSNVEVGHFVINPVINYIDPNCGSNKETSLSVTIGGLRFKDSATVTMGSVTASSVSVKTDGTEITCNFDLSGYTSGGYGDVMVINPDGGSVTLTGGFRVYIDPSDLVSWWKFDGDANDSVGSNNGSAGSGVSYTATPDRFVSTPNAAHGDGTSSSVISASITTELPNGAAARTMMGWFYLDSISASGENFLFGYGGTMERFKLSVTTGGRLAFSTAFGSHDLTGNTVVQTGRWYHAAVTYDGSTLMLYLDGMIDGKTDMALATPSGGSMYFLWFSTLFATTGALDDVMVLGRALTQTEIQEVAASGGYLLPPTNLSPSKGDYSDRVVLTWDAVLDATSYTISRSTSLSTGYSTLVSGVTANSYEDYSVTAGTIYFYKVAAEKKARSSEYTKAEIGFAGSLTTLTDTFEYTFASWWDSGQPVSYGSVSAGYLLDGGDANLQLISYTTSTGGSMFTEAFALTTTFSTAITYFSLSIDYLYTPGANVGGDFRVYVNNADPFTYPDLGIVPFKESLASGTWSQRTLRYIGDVGSVSTITLVFYDFTDTTMFNVDDLVIKYK